MDGSNIMDDCFPLIAHNNDTCATSIVETKDTNKAGQVMRTEHCLALF